jgi:hypothetical protein
MGTSTSFTLAYGILVENPEDHPWDHEHGDSMLCEEWWQDFKGFKPTFSPYNDVGKYVEGVSKDDPRILQYYDELRQWEKENPIPFDVEYVLDYDNEEMFICAPTTYSFYKQTNLDLVVDVSVLPEGEGDRFREFLREYYPSGGEPCWTLIPFHG